MTIWRGIFSGLIGGVVAAGAMTVVHKALIAIGSSTRQPTAAAEQEQDEDATVTVANGLARWLLRRPLPADKKPLAGSIVHYAFGASVGGLYGGLATAVPRVGIALGLPFGVAVWLGAHVIVVPALGLAAPPTRQLPLKEAVEFVSHLVYGTVTELARRFIRQTL